MFQQAKVPAFKADYLSLSYIHRTHTREGGSPLFSNPTLAVAHSLKNIRI